MTGYTVHTGSTVKFADGWDEVFGSKKPSPKKTAGTQAEPVSTHVHSQSDSRKKKSKKKRGGKPASRKQASTTQTPSRKRSKKGK